MQRGSPATSGAPAALYLDNRGGRRQKPLRDDADIAERGAGRAKLEDRCGRLPNRVPAGSGAVPVQGADNPAVLRAPERRWRCSRSDGRGGRWLRRDAGRRTGTAAVGEVLSRPMPWRRARYPPGLAAADVAANAVAPAVEAAAFSKAAHAATSDEVTAACEPKDAATKVQPNDQVNAGNSLQVPGNTIRYDLAITGPKVYSDAAWKKRRSPGRERSLTTGLGIFCQFQEEQSTTKIFIQASTTTTPSTLQAESCALLLGAKVAVLLKLQQVTFLTDNLSLAKAAATSTTSDPQVLWEIRHLIAEYKEASKALSPKIYHINRDLNEAAHSCAQQAIRQSMSEPIFSCENSAHARMPCPTAILLQNKVFQGIVIHAVICS
nr:uncharacterized protein LOC127311400 [Lolium perenne]